MNTYAKHGRHLTEHNPYPKCPHCGWHEDVGHSKECPTSLVGTARIAGGCGPMYVVTAVRDEVAEILFPESDEMATLPVDSVIDDPLA